jgi:hypothetical protein
MKLNFELIKEILEKVESGDGFSRHSIPKSDYSENDNTWQEYMELAYHYRLLIDDMRLVNGNILTMPYRGGQIPCDISYTGLTAEGHSVLDAMRNDTIWGKLKKGALGLGKEALKETPALFIKLALGGA